jgi:general secretion pathway protein I
MKPRSNPHRESHGFTLLEVMIAIAVVAIALMALLSLHHQSLQSVIRGQDSTRAALLAQDLMTRVELERFPAIGMSEGDFENFYPRQYPNFRWQRNVEALPVAPDMRKVTIRIIYGPRLARRFDLIELMRNPVVRTQ